MTDVGCIGHASRLRFSSWPHPTQSHSPSIDILWSTLFSDSCAQRMRLLYLQTSPVPPPLDKNVDRFVLLSEHLEGEVLQPIWAERPEQVENVFGPGSWPVYSRCRFRYRWLLAWRWTGFRRFLHTLRFYLAEARRVQREEPVDCVMTYSHMTPALCGIAIKLLTGAKLVVEIATSPDLSYLNTRPDPTLTDRLRKFYSDICLHVSMWSCDCVHLLYPEALNAYPLLRSVRRAVFHEFVAVSAVPRHESGGDPYILLVGAPWYLKGADVLVKAFRMLSADFPEVRLKIMGYFPAVDRLEPRVEKGDRIDILSPRNHPETLELISRASLVALPSRCEGMGRVLLEAMAAGIPVVGSKVGGIPTLIREGENGFLVPPGDVSALEDRMRRLLSDAALRHRMGARGYEMAHSEFNEKVYVDRFIRMIETAVRGESAGG